MPVRCRHHTRLSLLVGLSLCLVCPPAQALTIDQAIARALPHDASVVSADSRRRSADLELIRSRRWLPSNPYFNTTISSSTFEQSTGSGSQPGELAPGTENYGPAFTFFLEQEVEIAGQRSLRVRSGEQSHQITELNEIQAKRNAEAKVKTAFLTALMQRDLLQVEEDSLHWEREAEDGRDGERGQGIGRTEEETRVWRARRAQRAALRQLEESMGELRHMIRATPAEALTLEGSLPNPLAGELPPLDTLLAIARRERADLQSQRLVAEWSQVQLTLAKRNEIPSPSLSVFVSHDENGQQYGGGIGIPLPIFESPALDVRAAAVDLDKAREDVGNLEARMEAEVRAAYLSCTATAEDLRDLQQQILPRLRRIAEQRDKQFDRGQATAGQIIDAEMDVLDARRDEINVLAEHALAMVELERVVGAPPIEVNASGGTTSPEEQNAAE